MADTTNSDGASRHEVAYKLMHVVRKAEGKSHPNGILMGTREELLTLYSECLWAVNFHRKPKHED